MKFGFYTLGCKVNQFETQALEQLALERGHTICSANADAFIINTCTVTSVSEHKNIRAIHKIRRENPKAILAVCGCLSQMDPEKIRATGEVDLISGTENRRNLITQCEQAYADKQLTPPTPSANSDFEILPAGILSGRTRGLLKIEDGCDNFCSYCIIPYARGRVRSLPPDAALAQVQTLSQQGVKEIMVTGIEIASYGKDLSPSVSFISLIASICSAVPQIRIRLGSLEPRILTEEFCQTLAPYSNLARHFHLSLQSGCDKTLRDMNRKYTTADFLQAVQRLRRHFPDCSITGDLITGFPGETSEDFQQTLEFIQTCQFASLHVFPYSERSGTAAAKREDQIPLAIRQTRAEQAKQVANEMSQTFLASFIGKDISVLLESPQKGFTPAHSHWHFTVKIPDFQGSKNTVCKVRIVGTEGSSLIGKPL